MNAATTRLRALLLRWGLGLLGRTWRYREVVPAECAPALGGGEAVVVAFWHGAMLPVWYRFRTMGVAAVVSASADGDLLASWLRGLGYGTIVRGSSSRGGGEALGEMVEALKQGSCLITPDGPRGPAHRAKAGALVAARRSGRRLMLVGWSSRWVVRARSWDAMGLPLPFAAINIRYCIFDDPTQSDPHVSDDDIKRLNAALDDVTPISSAALPGQSETGR